MYHQLLIRKVIIILFMILHINNNAFLVFSFTNKCLGFRIFLTKLCKRMILKI